jgi:DNA-binding GntR family transcriptional regulator
MSQVLTEKDAQPVASIDESDGRSLSERAYDALLDRMLSGELPAGTLLQERPLAEVLQISRTPVREALAKLESEGLVTRHVGRLLIVREMLRTTFKAQMNGPLPDAGNHWTADDLLHGAICEASGNAVLAEMVRGLRRRTRMFNLKRMPERFLPGCREHLAIIEALARGDETPARRSMATHLENTKQSILNMIGKQTLLRSPLPSPVRCRARIGSRKTCGDARS